MSNQTTAEQIIAISKDFREYLEYNADPDDLLSALAEIIKVARIGEHVTENAKLQELRNQWQEQMLGMSPELQAVLSACITDLNRVIEQ